MCFADVKEMKNCLLICGLCLAVTACQPTIDSRGNVTVEESFKSFVIGKTTMDDVLTKCGTPSLHRDNYSWIYVGLKVEEDRMKNIKPFYTFIVKMTFNQNKILESIEKIDQNNLKEINMDEEIVRLISEKQAKLRVKTALSRNSNI
jgi:outer membrane protein assembly factor BamE (lipoprotein component of BamABCDE complex)